MTEMLLKCEDVLLLMLLELSIHYYCYDVSLPYMK